MLDNWYMLQLCGTNDFFTNQKKRHGKPLYSSESGKTRSTFFYFDFL